MHHFCAVLRDAALLVRLSHHETRDVLEKDEGHFALARHFDEVQRLERRLGKKNAIVREDGHGEARDMAEARDERGPVPRLEFVKARAVEDPREQLADVVRPAEVSWAEAVELVRGLPGLLGRD